ncbi:hypothetical protein LMG22465_02830 [Lactobacillus helveticus]|nr:hypothetical protein LMG22465_02830 [Lactobacillus helveticus]
MIATSTESIKASAKCRIHWDPTLTKKKLKNQFTRKIYLHKLFDSVLILSIEKNNVSNCTYLIKEIEKLLDNELNYYEQTVFLYATGYFEFKLNQSSGIEKMKNAIQVFDILGEDKIKAHYIEHYDKFVNK